ncbi:MAG: hypothetical protein H7Y00_01435 [Fimbriimonadaceae bacterium]|nr:hypothetical protein [Chitinophagales bacterium]
MPLLIGKPYVYLKETATSKELSVAVLCTSLAIDTMVVQNNTLVVKYKITTTGVITEKFDVDRLITTATYTKVIVKLYDKNTGVLKGSTTIPFVTAPPVGENAAYYSDLYKVFCYLQAVPTVGTHFYFYVNMDAGYKLPVNFTQISQLPLENKVIVYYDQISGGSGGPSYGDFIPPDPSTYNRIEVKVRNNTTTKGKGTTDQETADSSGDN